MSDQRDPYDVLDEANQAVAEIRELIEAGADKQSLLNKTESLSQKLAELPTRQARDEYAASLQGSNDTAAGGEDTLTSADSIEGADPAVLPVGTPTPVGGESAATAGDEPAGTLTGLPNGTPEGGEGSDTQPGGEGTDTIEGAAPDRTADLETAKAELIKTHTVKQLKQIAKDEEVDLGDKTLEADIAEAIAKKRLGLQDPT